MSVALRPSRNTRTRSVIPSGDLESRNPITGIDACCAPAPRPPPPPRRASLPAAPPRSEIKSPPHIKIPHREQTQQKGSFVLQKKIPPPMTALGHSRRISMAGILAACPLLVR